MFSSTRKRNVAVVFGGASQEHDVSVISAQQLMDAADCRKVDVIPIYMDFQNRFFTGSLLRDSKRFTPTPRGYSSVTFRWGEEGPTISYKSGRSLPVDCILPVLHGPFGEDGRVQSYFELLGFPVTGFTASNSAIAMRKDVAKMLVKPLGVHVLDHITVNRSRWARDGGILSKIERILQYPVVIKPANLGSSIGVAVASTAGEAHHLIERVFKWDDLALIEPKVEHLREFNVSVMTREGQVIHSAIESPKNHGDFLDFKSKYLSGPAGIKGGGLPSKGMLSLSRELNPDVSDSLKRRILDFSRKAFTALGGRGCPRIDFLYDQKSDELLFNEINPIPGSYGFFLWESAEEPLLFPELIDHLIKEALLDSIKSFDDPVPQEAALLPR